jgi:hypothetical protein
MSQSGEHTAKVPDAAGHIAYSAEEDAVWLECGSEPCSRLSALCKNALSEIL